MDRLLEIKDKFLEKYEAHERLYSLILKFIVMLVAMILIGINTGYNSVLSNIAVCVVIALVSAFLPMNLDAFILVIVICGQLFSFSAEVAAVALAMFLVMYFVYFRFSAKYAFVLVLLPVLFMLKIPFIIPILCGALASPVTIIPVLFGTAIYYVVDFAAKYSASLAPGEGDEKMTLAVQAVFQNQECLLTMLAFVVAIVGIYAIRRLKINNSRIIGILAGAVLCIVFRLFGYVLEGTASAGEIAWLFIGCIISIIIAIIVVQVIIPLDYSKTIKTQFEDEDYYYYVTAVPKHKLAAQKVNVKRIKR